MTLLLVVAIIYIVSITILFIHCYKVTKERGEDRDGADRLLAVCGYRTLLKNKGRKFVPYKHRKIIYCWNVTR